MNCTFFIAKVRQTAKLLDTAKLIDFVVFLYAKEPNYQKNIRSYFWKIKSTNDPYCLANECVYQKQLRRFVWSRCVGSKECMWAVTVSVWAFAAGIGGCYRRHVVYHNLYLVCTSSMCAVTAYTWADTVSMWTVTDPMWDVHPLCGLL